MSFLWFGCQYYEAAGRVSASPRTFFGIGRVAYYILLKTPAGPDKHTDQPIDFFSVAHPVASTRYLLISVVIKSVRRDVSEPESNRFQ